MKILKIIYIYCTYHPLIWVVLFISFSIRATIKLGHLPVPSFDDPKDLGMGIHFALVWLLFIFSLYFIALFWLVMTIIAKLKKRADFHLLRNTIIFFSGVIIMWCLLYFDPYRLITWFAD